MNKFIFELESHTRWAFLPNSCNEIDLIDDNQLIDYFNSKESELKKVFNDENFELSFSNKGQIELIAYGELSLNKFAIKAMNLLYFISVCSGYNVKYKDYLIYNNKKITFFSFPIEDTLPIINGEKIKLYKDIKYHEIGLKNIFDNHETFKMILNSDTRQLDIGINYYNCLFYKDMFNRPNINFKNIVASIESLISAINKDKYTEKENKNKDEFVEFTKENKKLEKFISIKRVGLSEKLIDTFKIIEDILSVKFNKNTINLLSEKIANTRNYLSHLYEVKSTTKMLTDNQIHDLSPLIQMIFRILYLDYFKIDKKILGQNFFKMIPNKIILKDFIIQKNKN